LVRGYTKGGGKNATPVTGRAGWASIAAVKHGAVLEVSDDVSSRWGPRVVTFIRQIAAGARAAAKAEAGQG
jgi:iron complex transport system substrate-binding protein